MSELQVLVSTQSSLASAGPDRPYLLYRSVNETGSVDVDVEWVSAESTGEHVELRFSVTEHVDGLRRVVSGAVFNAESGELLRAGESVSLAAPVDDWLERGSILADLGTELSSAQLLSAEHLEAA